MAVGRAWAFNPQAHIWISPHELATLTMQGPAWERLKAQAKAPAGSPNLSDKDQDHNVYVLAKALVYARCSLVPAQPQCVDIPLTRLGNEVRAQVMAALGTESGGGHWPWGGNWPPM
jgi:hypothetical protein